METIVLSGPAERVGQARQMLAQKGLRVEDSTETINGHVPGGLGKVAKRDYSHGFDVVTGEGWITSVGDLEDWHVVEPLGFVLRLHSITGSEGEWNNPKSSPKLRDPLGELEELKGLLRSQGLKV